MVTQFLLLQFFFLTKTILIIDSKYLSNKLNISTRSIVAAILEFFAGREWGEACFVDNLIPTPHSYLYSNNQSLRVTGEFINIIVILQATTEKVQNGQ